MRYWTEGRCANLLVDLAGRIIALKQKNSRLRQVFNEKNLIFGTYCRGGHGVPLQSVQCSRNLLEYIQTATVDDERGAGDKASFPPFELAYGTTFFVVSCA
jgi:hypothetical protein